MIQDGTSVYFVVSNLYIEEGIVVRFGQGRYTVRVVGENSRHAGPCGIRLCESRLYTSMSEAKKALARKALRRHPARECPKVFL